LQNIVETNLRATQGNVIERPLGSPRKFPSLNSLMFDFAQLNTLPTPGDVPIDMSVTIGPQAAKPLMLKTPIIIAGMAYGYALSEAFKIALAKGATMVGTATNTGEGAWLESERKAADKLILQYNRGHWAKETYILKKADAIEIQFGQGVIGGVAHNMLASSVDKTLRKAFGVKLGEDVVVHSRHPQVYNSKKLGELVSHLREITNGVPIGIKIGAGKYLEADLNIAIESGIDFISVCGTAAATKGSAPILQDDFGLPTIFALSRTSRFLEEQNVKEQVSLIVGGKLLTPGDYLKAIALGADAVYVGTMALFAASHTQVLHPLPFEPPTQIAWYDGKFQKKFNIDTGAKNLANYLTSCTLEMTEGIRALGKTSLKDLNTEDLFSLDPLISDATGIPLGYKPMPY
jgi:glutamate synthase domain-containing protein 2